jgi:hypothetical protein
MSVYDDLASAIEAVSESEEHVPSAIEVRVAIARR